MPNFLLHLVLFLDFLFNPLVCLSVHVSLLYCFKYRDFNVLMSWRLASPCFSFLKKCTSSFPLFILPWYIYIINLFSSIKQVKPSGNFHWNHDFLKKILFIYSWERERQRHRQREKQGPCREPDVGLDPGTPGPCPGPKAGTKPLSHAGITETILSFAFPCLLYTSDAADD